MKDQNIRGRTAHAALFSLLLLACSATLDAQEQALAVTHDNPALEWGPCPGFFPEGCRIAVLHGDPGDQNADISKHTHTSAERMVLVSGELHVTYDGQDTVVLRPGSYAYGPPALPHDAVCAAGAPCVLFIAFEQPVDAMPAEG
ncbi:MAG: cupin domain-containing protein [Gammaproteobacteria bacterium]